MNDTWGRIATVLAVSACVWAMASKWTSHEALVMEQAREIKQLEQIISVTRPDVAVTFGINQEEP